MCNVHNAHIKIETERAAIAVSCLCTAILHIWQTLIILPKHVIMVELHICWFSSAQMHVCCPARAWPSMKCSTLLYNFSQHLCFVSILCSLYMRIYIYEHTEQQIWFKITTNQWNNLYLSTYESIDHSFAEEMTEAEWPHCYITILQDWKQQKLNRFFYWYTHSALETKVDALIMVRFI